MAGVYVPVLWVHGHHVAAFRAADWFYWPASALDVCICPYTWRLWFTPVVKQGAFQGARYGPFLQDPRTCLAMKVKELSKKAHGFQ